MQQRIAPYDVWTGEIALRSRSAGSFGSTFGDMGVETKVIRLSRLARKTLVKASNHEMFGA